MRAWSTFHWTGHAQLLVEFLISRVPLFSVAVCSVMKVELLQLCSVRYRLGEQPFEPLVHFSEGSLSLGGGCDGGGWGKSSPEDMTLLRPSLQRHSSNVAFLFVSCFLSSSCLISRLQICFQHFWCWLLVKISDVPAQYVFCLCCSLMIMWPSKLRMSLLTNTHLGSTQLQLSQSQRSQSSREMDSFHS